MTKLSDGGGLQLWVERSGARYWRVAYRYESKQRVLAVGTYPTVSLADARAAREAAKRLLSQGVDPMAAKKAAKVKETAAQATFGMIASEYVEKLRAEGRAAQTLVKTEWLVRLAAKLADRPVAEIKPAEVLACCKAVEARGKRETAHRLRVTLSAIFRFAVATARSETDPAAPLRGALLAADVTPRAAITTPAKFGELLRAIDGYEGAITTRYALQMLALTFQRPGEVRMAEWCEFDLDAATWRIPAARMKGRVAHELPLARQTVALLQELHAVTGEGELCFPGYGRAGKTGEPMKAKPISENTTNAALRRLGFNRETMSSHGFRSAASSMLNESRLFHPDVIERQLAHVDGNAIRAKYDRARHWDERVRLAQHWADEVDRMRKLPPKAKGAGRG